jgi:hypothetical protein
MPQSNQEKIPKHTCPILLTSSHLQVSFLAVNDNYTPSIGLIQESLRIKTGEEIERHLTSRRVALFTQNGAVWVWVVVVSTLPKNTDLLLKLGGLPHIARKSLYKHPIASLILSSLIFLSRSRTRGRQKDAPTTKMAGGRSFLLSVRANLSCCN